MHTESRGELLDLLKKEIEGADGLIVIQAGHFALVHDEKNDKSIPGIFNDIKDKEQKKTVKEHPYMGHFPIETWKIGIELYKHGIEKGKEVKLAVAINDWQWIKKVSSDDSSFKVKRKKIVKSEGNKYREEFFKNLELPKSYKAELEKNGLDESIILPSRTQSGKIANKLFFSETRLRKRYTRYFSETYNIGAENQCAREYIPLLNEINDQGIKLFISFIPKTCLEPIIIGSQKSKEDYDIQDLKIINIFPSGIFNKDFWEDIEISIV